MSQAATLAISLALVVTLAWALELALRPRVAWPHARKRWANLVHVLTLLAFWALCLAITAKPWLSAALVLSLVLLIVLVNHDKYRQLNEPFLTCDFIYFWDVIRYPRLYLPFFGYAKAALLLVAFLLALGFWWQLEPNALTTWLGRLWWLVVALASLAPAYYLAQKKLASDLSLSPEQDLRELGLVAMLMAHKAAAGLWQRSNPVLPTPFVMLKRAPDSPELPDIICIQAESFFDVRQRYGERLAADSFAHWDQARAKAWRAGQLRVPAWGANTVRSEFGFLSGLPADRLGVHQFQPYALVKRMPGPFWQDMLPARLKALGFHCSFVHPYIARFYDRHQVLPKLGFDEFIDIRGLGPMGSLGAFDPHAQYMPDPVLGESIVQRLRARRANQPVFMHVVTMQGHGPYDGHGKDPESLFNGYVRVMQSTDLMIGQLLNDLQAGTANRPTVVCVFGDHVPILPSVYAAWGAPDGSTDYLIWRNWDQSSRPIEADLALHELAMSTAHAAGLHTGGRDGSV